jgi:hypothetical protein
MVGRKATRSKSNHARSTLMATKLTCADLQKSTLDHLSIFHCSNCDLFNNERNTCMALKQLLTQDKWGCQFRCTCPVTDPIQVRVVNSAWLGENYPSSATPPSTEITNPPVCMPVHDSSRCGDDCCVPPDTGIRVATANYKKRKQDEAFDAVTSELEEVPHFLHVAEWSMSRCTQILQYHIIIQLLQYHIIIQLDGCSTDRQKKAFRIP